MSPSGGSVQLVARLDALHRPRTPSDSIPHDAGALAESITTPSAGHIELMKGRRLLKLKGELALYGVPTSSGWVTFVLGGLGGRCIPTLLEHLGWLLQFDGRSTYFYGVADNEVRTIGGLPSGMTGKFADNGFVFIGPGRVRIDSVEIVLGDGRTKRVTIQS